MIWRNLLIGGAAIAIGNGMALDPETGRVLPMVSQDLAIDPQGQVEYVVPMPESGSGSSFYTRRHGYERRD